MPAPPMTKSAKKSAGVAVNKAALVKKQKADAEATEKAAERQEDEADPEEQGEVDEMARMQDRVESRVDQLTSILFQRDPQEAAPQ